MSPWETFGEQEADRIASADEWARIREEEAVANKHDADCLRRREANPYLCTCGMTDGQVGQVDQVYRDAYATGRMHAGGDQLREENRELRAERDQARAALRGVVGALELADGETHRDIGHACGADACVLCWLVDLARLNGGGP